MFEIKTAPGTDGVGVFATHNIPQGEQEGHSMIGAFMIALHFHTMTMVCVTFPA